MEITEGRESEAVIRLIAFFGVFCVMAIWEVAAPRLTLNRPRGERWMINMTITAINTALARLLLPAVALGAAFLAEDNGWGLLHRFPVPESAAFVVSFLGLDLAIYAQHVAFHHVPLLWRFHCMHHVDLDMDVTTALRFHPVEILASLLIKAGVVMALGADPLTVILFEIVLNASALFNHGNVRVPGPVDAGLRMVIVTPDMHRVHHSTTRSETDSNFGFFLSVWDRVFGTYTVQPARGHDAMEIGQPSHRDPRQLTVSALLILPFRGLK